MTFITSNYICNLGVKSGKYCVAVFCFALVGLLLVLVFGFLLVLFDGDFVTAYWTALRSFTSSLLRPLNQQTAMYALIN